AEHGVPLGTHGTALYRELQHVPMIFFVPENPPHEIHGAVSNLDVAPTIAELAGIEVKDLGLEGRSEVPAIFYDKEDRDRIVCAGSRSRRARTSSRVHASRSTSTSTSTSTPTARTNSSSRSGRSIARRGSRPIPRCPKSSPAPTCARPPTACSRPIAGKSAST